jgi:hypothetical protein
MNMRPESLFTSQPNSVAGSLEKLARIRNSGAQCGTCPLKLTP